MNDPYSIISLIEIMWKEAVDNNRDNDALAIAILAYYSSAEKKDKVAEQGAVSMLHSITENMLKKFHVITQSCSFCGRSPPEVRLGGGGNNIYICDSCVEGLSQSFKINKS